MTSTGREGCAPMTPDLIARLREKAALFRRAVAEDDPDAALFDASADALETLMEHAEAMAKALIRVSDIVDRNLYRQHEKIEDVPRIASPVLAAYRSAFPEVG